MTPPDEGTIASRLDKLLADFGHEYDWPYRFMSNSKPPADQQLEAQKQLRAEAAAALSVLIRDVVTEVIGEDQDPHTADPAARNGLTRNYLRNEQRRRLNELLPEKPKE